MSKPKKSLLSLDLPDDEAARAVAEALARKRAIAQGTPVTVVVPDDNGNEVYTAVAKPIRH